MPQRERHAAKLVEQASRPWLCSLVILVVRRYLLSHLNMSVKRSAPGHNPEPGAPHFSQGGRVGEKKERRIRPGDDDDRSHSSGRGLHLGLLAQLKESELLMVGCQASLLMVGGELDTRT